ncbi:MAG: ATP-dependent RecD-like DNA helicase [Clostridiales bacterium]|nr:ATP-dependent RecD-like DNA helicase [Clostridiales bacterium]
MPEYSGRVDALIFRNEDNGYSVLVIKPEQGKAFTCFGTLPFAQEGDLVRLEGEWTRHPDYGEQLKVSRFSFDQPATAGAIIKYLSSGGIAGIGPDTAKRIVDHFGAETLKIMYEHPERLTQVHGIGKVKAARISADYLEKRGGQEILMYFLSLGISPSVALKIYKQYGRDAVTVCRSDPYRMADDIRGIGFLTADSIASGLGYFPEDPRRLQSGIKYVLTEALNGEGHTFLPCSELLLRAEKALKVPVDSLSLRLEQLIAEGRLVREETDGVDAVFLKYVYECELDIAVRLVRLNLMGSFECPCDVPETLSDGTVLSKAQQLALKQSLSNRVSVITGGPGTGKTTLLKGILECLPAKEKVALCAPTGRAAKRIGEATGREAKTIHRLLGYAMGEEAAFNVNEDNPLDADTVVVDEMSMVDIFLMRALLRALKPSVRLILTGDADQLPSVGAGNVLKDIILCGRIPTSRLCEVFRQEGGSRIVTNAHLINKGEMPVMNQKDSDFYITRSSDAANAQQEVISLVTRRLPAYMGLDPMRDIQVMSPMKRGDAGVYALNALLQSRLNPAAGRPCIKRGDTSFYSGDKVMQIKNDYSLCWVRDGEEGQGVFNGDIGYVTDVDPEDKTVSVRFEDGREAVYEKDMLEELELSYCISVHKSQGSEFDCVVLPLLNGPEMLMTRNLLYTAVTRAKKLVVIVGKEECVRRMVNNNYIERRFSSLCPRLKLYACAYEAREFR